MKRMYNLLDQNYQYVFEVVMVERIVQGLRTAQVMGWYGTFYRASN